MASAAALIGEAVRERAQGLDRCLQAARTGPFVDARRIEAALSLLPPGFSSALLAGSFSRARLARGAGEGGGERIDPTPDGLGDEDEDAEFERRADGHLGAWAAPTYDADDADDAGTLEGLQTRHSAPEEAHTIVLDGRQPCVDMANGASVSASHQGGAGRQASCPAAQPERAERDERAERAGAVEQAPGEHLTRSTWRERLVRTIGVASCCTAGDVEGEVFGGALASELPRRTSEPETPGRKAAGPAGGLRAGPGGKDQGLEEAPLQQTEAAKRTQEWATLFGQGWGMAAGGTRVHATAADDGPKRSCSQTGGSGHVGARIVETPGAQPTISEADVHAHVKPHVTRGWPASRGAGVRDTQAVKIGRKPEAGQGSRAGESPGLWAAPLDCGESEEAEDRALGEHEGRMGGKNQDVTTDWRCKAEEEEEVVDPERDRACDTVHMTPEAGSESRETPAQSCAPVARLQPSLAVSTPKAEGSAVKTMINRLRNSPGGLLRKSSLQASAQLGTPQGAAPRGPSAVEHVLVEALPPSPAAHITNLVKKAEKDFEKEYGVGTWGASTRRLAHRMGAGDDIESSDEDGDLVV
jgi:hypothetical protein